MVFIWKVTERCNLRCTHCYVGSPLKRSKKYDFPQENIKDFFYFIERFGEILAPKSTIILHGGEPFLRNIKFYDECYRYFSQLREKMEHITFESSVQTNFLLYRHDFDFYIKNLFGNRIGTSWDGTMSPYRRTRDGDIKKYFNKLEYNIATLKDRNPDVRIGVLILLNNFNTSPEDIPVLVKEILELSPSSVRLNVIHDSRLMGKSYQVNYDNIFGAMVTIYKYLKSYDPNIGVFPIDDMKTSLKVNYSVNCPFLWNCPVGYVLVRSDGTVGNCDEYGMDIISNETIFSDVIKILSKKTALAYERYKSIKYKECKGCKFLPVCQGGCMVRTYMYKKDYTAKDPMCRFHRQLFEWVNNNLLS